MITRTISGLIFIAIIIGALWAGFIPSLVLFSIISFLGTIEFYRLSKDFAVPYKYTGAIFSSLIVLFMGWFIIMPDAKWLFAGLVITTITFITLLLKSHSETVIVDISITFAGALYLAIPFVSLLALGIIPSFDYTVFNYLLPLSVFCLTWVNDIGAYLVGRSFGKHKLFERISPKKTWEGSIGGLFFSLLGAYVLSILTPDFSIWVWLGIGVLVSVFANIGDLMESSFKRNAGVKDSGNIMPGHGGILDRFDAILLTAPVVLAYLLVVTNF